MMGLCLTIKILPNCLQKWLPFCIFLTKNKSRCYSIFFSVFGIAIKNTAILTGF